MAVWGINEPKVFSVLQTITVFVSVAHGFGKSIDLIGPSDLASIQKVVCGPSGVADV